MQYSFAVVGGTFDHFHAGHKKLLFAACSQSQKIVIGVATDKLFQHKVLRDQIEDFETRKKSVQQFLQENNFSAKVSIIPLSDIYGNSLQDTEIDAIFVTEDTKPNAIVINTKRKELGHKALTIVTVPFVLADDGEKISSDRIRLGEIDRNGFSYTKFLQRSKALHLPESLREELRKPIGIVVQTFDHFLLPETREFVVSVGDIVTQDLIQAGIQPTVSIIDFKTQRQVIEENKVLDQLKAHAIHFDNAPATINTQFADIFSLLITKVIHNQETTTIIVNGEEDLLTLPAILLAPLGLIVMYGQMDVGAVFVEVTEEKKEEVKKILEKFR